ncbi:MAG: hypothetical protein BWK75_01555 [Candidatus Altiarchaeales archaeon A3]|nr:MAG: hypothetical protein BWK75_01555 [Candidatus Altiarchaeales archaeon A3]
MNWNAIKQLNQLFIGGKTSDNLMKFPYIKRLYSMEGFIHEKKILIKTEHFDSLYLKKDLEQFNNFNKLLLEYDLTETNFEFNDLEALVKITADKEVISEKIITQKEISTLYFDDAKYLKTGSKLYGAVLKVLELDTFPVDEHDQQFLYVLHCKNKIPKTIILCENDNQLRKPRLNDVELWFAGGRNTAKLKFVNELITIPFYYLCDWDNKGIEIYQDIKNIFPNIQILVPQEPLKLMNIKREWKTKINYSLFTDEAKTLLEKLIPEKWIEEESINHDLLKR